MRYNFEYEINESGRFVLRGLSFENRYVEVPREEQFRMLYSYALINIDMWYAINFLEQCDKSTDDIARQCFFRMAVIQYAKCYSPPKNGGRTQLDARMVYRGLPDDPIGCHKKFIEMRNKYLAHDENDFKASKLGAVLNVKEQKIVGIAYPMMQAKFDYPPTISILMQLCQKTREWVNEKLDSETSRILKYISQREYEQLSSYNDLEVNDIDIL